MHGHNTQHVSGFGKIITGPGVVIPLTDNLNTVAFGARGDSTVVLMTTDNFDFERLVEERREAICSLLRRHAYWDGSPVTFMENLANLAINSPAMAQSAISNLCFDAGSCLFHDKMFATTTTGDEDPVNPNSPSVKLRTVCSPALDTFCQDYVVKPLSSVMSSLKGKAHPDVIAERKKIVASAISILVATAIRVTNLTDMRLTYVPDGHCINVVMPKCQNGPSERFPVYLVINDPIGAGWKILGDLRSSLFDEKGSVVSRLETLMEFSCKCIIDALLVKGMDNASMKRIVDSMEVPCYRSKASGGHLRVSLSTAGNSTVTGEGSIVINRDGESHEFLLLTEFQVAVEVMDGKTSIAIKVEPTIKGSEHSPSILHWYPPIRESQDTTEMESANEKERKEENAWKTAPVALLPIFKTWRACHISDDALGDDSWKNKLVHLHRFGWERNREKGNRIPEHYDTLFDKIAAASAIITSRTFTDRGISNDVEFFKKLTCQESTRVDKDLINAVIVLSDVYGFSGNGNKPIVALEKTSCPEEWAKKEEAGAKYTRGDNDCYILTLTGNAPNASSVLAIQLVKLKSYCSPTSKFVDEFEKELGSARSSACHWYGICPSTARGFSSLSEEDDNSTCFIRIKHGEQSRSVPIFFFTPRCVFHTDHCHVHIYSDWEGPFRNVKYDPLLRHMTIGGPAPESPSAAYDGIDSLGGHVIQTIERPLIVAAVASITRITINANTSAHSFGVSLSSYEECLESLDKTIIKMKSGSGVIWSEVDVSRMNIEFKSRDSDVINTIGLFFYPDDTYMTACDPKEDFIAAKCLEENEHDGYFVCPTEAAIQEYYTINGNKKAKSNFPSDNEKKASVIIALAL
uniref:Wsv442-like protein n=1 Tax=Metapenaeus ensis nimavirus TaxID=2133794 RepID=A0A401IPE0_9VIRU|nr:MAG: wsv442-like protein [Metapenaeus ensis nimavirus]GBG35476.1 wsv442-like protein [Metapenaeus ensis nimavirus]